MKWIAPTEYGDLDITINLSKPEKDPKAIAAAKLVETELLIRSVCYVWKMKVMQGRLNHPARQNHQDYSG